MIAIHEKTFTLYNRFLLGMKHIKHMRPLHAICECELRDLIPFDSFWIRFGMDNRKPYLRDCHQPSAVSKAVFPYSIVELSGLAIPVFEEYRTEYFKNDILHTLSPCAAKRMLLCSDDIPYQRRRNAVVFKKFYYPRMIRHILRLCVGSGKSYIEISLHRVHGRYTSQEKSMAYHILPHLQYSLPAACFLAYYECLSGQEKKIALNLARGLSSRASALASGIAHSTVREYLSRAIIKTCCPDFTQFRYFCQSLIDRANNGRNSHYPTA